MNIRRTVTCRLKELGQNQSWLAEQVGVTRQQISAFLAGDRGMSEAAFMRMLDALRLEIRPKGRKR